MKKAVAVSAILLFVLTLPSCKENSQWAGVWKEGGNLADLFLSIYVPNWPHRETLKTTWNTAYGLIEGWKTGTPCSNVMQAITSAVDLLAQIPVVGQEQINLMAVIVATTRAVAASFSSCAPTPRGVSPTFPPGVVDKANSLKPPTTVKEVDALWESQGGKVPK